MPVLTNCTKQAVAVADAGGHKAIAPGASVDVDGHQNWKEHLFVKAGWLTLSGTEQETVPEPAEDREPETVKTDKPRRRKR